jgi:hypothetical protein
MVLLDGRARSKASLAQGATSTKPQAGSNKQAASTKRGATSKKPRAWARRDKWEPSQEEQQKPRARASLGQHKQGAGCNASLERGATQATRAKSNTSKEQGATQAWSKEQHKLHEPGATQARSRVQRKPGATNR